MKTLFFILTCFLSGSVLGFADDQDPYLKLTPWHATNPQDIVGAPTVGFSHSLDSLKAVLNFGTSMSTVVIQCGLPDAEFNPGKFPPLPSKATSIAGNTIVDEYVIELDENWHFRYDLPGQGRIYITTGKDQRIQEAFFYSFTTGAIQYLVK